MPWIVSPIWHTTRRLILEAQADKARALATVSLAAVLLRDYGTLERYLGDLEGAVAYAEVRRADGQVLGQTGTRLPGIELLHMPMHAAGEEIGECSRKTIRTLEEVEIYWIRHVLERCGGNRTQAARRLGIDPSTLWRKLKEAGA